MALPNLPTVVRQLVLEPPPPTLPLRIGPLADASALPDDVVQVVVITLLPTTQVTIVEFPFAALTQF
jgi:hypothetical protein